MTISIVVPVFNEAEWAPKTLRYLADTFSECELIAVDGGSTDETVALIKPYVRVMVSQRGRAYQMNAGARATSGEILWFIHADSQVQREALPLMYAALKNPAIVGGGFRLRFAEHLLSLRAIAYASNLRAKYLQWIFGDQSLFVRRSYWDAVGQFPAQPIMEDLELSRRLKQYGKLVLLPSPSQSSGRRLIRNGIWRTIVGMQAAKLRYFLGVAPDRIVKTYPGAGGPA